MPYPSYSDHEWFNREKIVLEAPGLRDADIL